MKKCILAGLTLLLLFAISPLSGLSQGAKLTGTVKADNGQPVQGATITVKGKKVAGITDEQGRFTIEALVGDVLEFSAIGYAKRTVAIRNTAALAITLAATSNDLQDVVVVAMDQKRNPRELGFSTQSLDGDEIKDAQRENFLNGMQGRIAGLTVNPTSGMAGASTQIVLRGFNSMSLDNSPLFVIDGVIWDNETTNTGSLTGTTENRREDFTNRIADLNPNDIGSITVLKGPEATALYGSQASSGAIIITTKRSTTKKGIGVSYDNSFRISKLIRTTDSFDDYSSGSSGLATNVFGAFGPKYDDGVQTFNNKENFFKTGFAQTHNLSLDFGTAASSFRVSGSIFDQEGFVPANAFQKYNFRISNTTKIGKYIDISPSISYIYSKNQKVMRGASGYLLNLLTWPANNDIREWETEDGLKKPIFAENPNSEIDNPFFSVYRHPGQDKTNRWVASLGINIRPFSWLTVSGRFGYDYYDTDGYLQYDSSSFYLTRAQKGWQRNYSTKYYGYNHTITATAKKDFGKFTTRLMVGNMWQDYETNIWSQNGTNLYVQRRKDSFNTDPTTRAYLFNQQFRNGEPNFSIKRMMAYFGEAMVGWDNKIFLTYSHRFEESSIFPKEFRNYNYPAASLSIIMSDLIPGIKSNTLGYWKLRGSLANTARASSPYANQSTFSANLGSGAGFFYDFTNANPNLEPERQNTFEIGTELRMFQDRLNVDMSYYNTSNKNLIVQNFRASYGTGFVLNTLNVGETNNKGIEIAIALDVVRGHDFTWRTRFNFNKMWNNIVALPSNVPEFYISDTWLYGNARGGGTVGLPTTTLTGFGYKRNNAGQVLINPLTGIPINDNLFKVRGDRNPDFTLGWVNNLAYKNWSLSMLWDLKVGGDIYNATEKYLTVMGRSLRTADRETPRIVSGVLEDGLENTANPTKNTIVVTPYYNNIFYTTAMPEEEFIQKDVNWFRLRDVTLNYQFGSKVLKALKVVKNMGAFITVTDPILFSNYNGADPQVNGNTAGSRGVGGFGIDYGNVGMPLSINLGMRAGF